MTTAFEKLYKFAESLAGSNDEMYMPQPFGQDPEHQSSMDPVDPEPLEITQPKEDGNQFTGSKTAHGPETHCEVKGCKSPVDGVVGDDNYLCSDHFHQYFNDDNYGGIEIHWPIHEHNIKQHYGSKKEADISNTDENPSPGNIMAPKSVYKVNVEDPPEQQLFGDAGETSRGDGSINMLASTVNPEARKIVRAYIAENGEPQCSVCENYYTPKSIAQAKLAHCGHCPEDLAKIEEGDVVDGDVVKTSKEAHTNEVFWPNNGEELINHWHSHHSQSMEGAKNDMGISSEQHDNMVRGNPSFFLKLHTEMHNRPGAKFYSESTGHSHGDLANSVIFENEKNGSKVIKTSNDSELYTRGFLDHLHGKPLDEDLAVLSDDYFNGYDQARYYGKTPLESVGAKPHQVKTPAFADTSLDGWEPIDRINHKYDIDRSEIIASTLPTNVLEAFFDTDE